MSIFSKIKGAKKAADHHKKKAEAAASTPEPRKVPYKHIPTHAATDSLNVGGTRDEDMRERIREQHKRRSTMGPTRSGTETSLEQRARIFAHSSSDLSIASVMQRHASYTPPGSRQRAHFSHGSSSSMCLRPSPLSATPSLTATEESVEEDESPEGSPVVSSQTSTKSNSSYRPLEMKRTSVHWPSERFIATSQPEEKQSSVSVETPVVTLFEPVGLLEQKQPTIIETSPQKSNRWTFGRRRSSSAAIIVS